MLKKIVVFHDLSKASEDALDWAINLGCYFRSRLKVVHILDQEALLGQDPVSKIKEIKMHIRKQLNSYEFVCQYMAQKMCGEIGPIEIRVRQGKTIPSILQMIQQEKPDLVVAGTHSRKGLKHIFWGSVVENVVRYSPAPVLVAKRAPNLPPKKIRGILIPTDFSKFTEETLLLGIQLSKQVECDLTLAHIIGFSDHEKKAKKTAMRKLQSIIAKHPSLKIKPYVSVGPVVDEISKAAKRTDSDIILMPTHGHTGLSHLLMGSVAEMVVRYSDCNVLSFCPEKPALERKKLLRKI